MRVLVTGGTGYLGRSIVDALAARGHQPVVLSREGGSSGPASTRVRGDIRHLDTLQAAAEGVDAIVHAAALVAQWRRDPSEFDAVNVGGLRNVLDAARRAGVGRIVYTSSFLALPPAGRQLPLTLNDYQRTKVEALGVAHAAQREGAPVIVVHPGVVYGPGRATEGDLVGRLLRDYLAQRLPGLIGPERIWSFSFVGDVALGHVLALERGRAGHSYGLGGPNQPQGRLFELASGRLGRRPPRRLPFPVARAVAVAAELGARALNRPPLLTRGAVEIFRHDWPVDSGPAERELGYRVTPLEEGLERLLSAWRVPDAAATLT